MKITEIDFISIYGKKYVDSNGVKWEVKNYQLVREMGSNLSDNGIYIQRIDELYTLYGITTLEFEEIIE